MRSKLRPNVNPVGKEPPVHVGDREYLFLNEHGDPVYP